MGRKNVFANKSAVLCVGIGLILLASDALAHSGPLNSLALKACEAKKRSSACQYEGVHNDLYIGTCQYMAEALMCVRNKPIQIIDNDNSEEKATHTHSEKKQTSNGK
jgi:hypothetical protein